MQVLSQITQLPFWFIIILLVLLLVLLTVALVTKRQVQFWPPSIGPSQETIHLENQVKLLQSQLDNLNSRYAALEHDAVLSQQKLKEESALYQRKLEVIGQPAGSDTNIIKLLNLFDRKSLRIPLSDENLSEMLKSLIDLRVQLQKSGVSSFSNVFIQEIFDEIKKELERIENTLILLSEMDLVSEGENILKGQQSANISPMTRLELVKLNRMIDKLCHFYSMRKADNSSEIVPRGLLTLIWFFGSIDAIRQDILFKVEFLKRLANQSLRVIQINGYLVKVLLAQNLKLWQEYEKQHGVGTAGKANRYSIQFDPATGSCKPALFDTFAGRIVDLSPDWEIFMLPVPQNEDELSSMYDAISAGINHLSSPGDKYYGEIIY